MAIDTSETRSPGWWLQKLYKKLEQRAPIYQERWDRYQGKNPVPNNTANPEAEEAYKKFRRLAKTNFSELIVESRAQRMQPLGVRTGATDTKADDETDPLGREIYDNNGLAVELPDTFRKALAMGDAFGMVGMEDGEVVITGEDPRQVVSIHDPVRNRIIRASAKFFHDDDEDKDYGYLYLDGKRYVASRARRATKNKMVRFSAAAWEWDEERGGSDGDDIGGGVLQPVVRFRNKLEVPEFDGHIDVMDRIDQQVFQRLVIAAVQAFRQRAALNTDDTEIDEDGEEHSIDWESILTSDPGVFWRIPGEKATIWESSSTDITPLVAAEISDRKTLASVSSTPMHLFFPDAASGSAEGAALMREQLVFTVEDRMLRFGESIKDMFSIAFKLSGDEERAKRSNIDVLWRPAERRSLAERADAWSKLEGLPLRTKLIEIMGFTQTEAARIMAERSEDQLNDVLAVMTQRPDTVTDPLPAAA